MQPDNKETEKAGLSVTHFIQVILLSIYCVCLIAGPIGFLYLNFNNLISSTSTDERLLFGGVVLMGVLGSALRGIARLFSDVGKSDYQPSWNLSILMRPLEGAGIALLAYFAIKAGIILLEQGDSNPNPFGFLFFGVLSGMFSHRAADALRERFDHFWGVGSVGKTRKTSRKVANKNN